MLEFNLFERNLIELQLFRLPSGRHVPAVPGPRDRQRQQQAGGPGAGHAGIAGREPGVQGSYGGHVRGAALFEGVRGVSLGMSSLRDDSALRALSSLRGLRGAPALLPLCQETQSLGQQMLNATVGINGLKE